MENCIDEVNKVLPINEEDIANIHISRVDETCGYGSYGPPIVNEEQLVVAEDIPVKDYADIYEGVEEIDLEDGTVFIAVKRGSAIQVDRTEDNFIRLIVLGNANQDAPVTSTFTFPPIYIEAKQYWLANRSEFIDVEVEEITDIYTTKPLTGKDPKGYRKSKNIKASQLQQVSNQIKNRIEKNRAKTKQAKKSRTVNRRKG